MQPFGESPITTQMWISDPLNVFITEINASWVQVSKLHLLIHWKELLTTDEMMRGCLIATSSNCTKQNNQISLGSDMLERSPLEYTYGRSCQYVLIGVV